MRCEICEENHARYIAIALHGVLRVGEVSLEHDQSIILDRRKQILLTCAICPIKHDMPSVRIIDIKLWHTFWSAGGLTVFTRDDIPRFKLQME